MPGASTSVRDTPMAPTSPRSSPPYASDFDPDWIKCGEFWQTAAATCAALQAGLSTGDSESDIAVSSMVVMAEVGQYCFGPLNKKESSFANRYTDMYWHVRNWTLLPWGKGGFWRSSTDTVADFHIHLDRGASKKNCKRDK
jgi:hypothetical protein